MCIGLGCLDHLLDFTLESVYKFSDYITIYNRLSSFIFIQIHLLLLLYLEPKANCIHIIYLAYRIKLVELFE